MNRKYERPEIKQITKQWVRENCKNITERDIGLLQTIYENKRRILRRDQLEILYPKFASTDRLNKRLSLLYKMHVIDKIYPPVGLGQGSSKQYVCLDRAGIILLDLEKYNKPITLDRNGNKSLPLGWEHKVMLNDYECCIQQMMREQGGQILFYEVEESHPYRDTRLIPDIMCMIKYKGKGYTFFIEIDLGTEDIPYVKGKINSYIDYYISKQWCTQPWAKMFKTPSFPRILFLTENNRPKRVSTLQEHTKDCSVRFIFGNHINFRKILMDILEG